MAPILKSYLASVAGEPFAWGRADCMTFAGDWVMAMAGIDPVAHWRRTYESEAEALKIISDAGGLAVLMESGLRSAGWRTTLDPTVGDVACATLPGHAAPIGGIVCPRGNIAFKGRRGLVLWPASILRAWHG